MSPLLSDDPAGRPLREDLRLEPSNLDVRREPRVWGQPRLFARQREEDVRGQPHLRRDLRKEESARPHPGDYQPVDPDPHVARELERLALDRLGRGQRADLDPEGAELGGPDPGEPGVVRGGTDGGVNDGLLERLHGVWHADATPEPPARAGERHEGSPVTLEKVVRYPRPRGELVVAWDPPLDHGDLDRLPRNRD